MAKKKPTAPKKRPASKALATALYAQHSADLRGREVASLVIRVNGIADAARLRLASHDSRFASAEKREADLKLDLVAALDTIEKLRDRVFKLETKAATPAPGHDWAWALEQMRAGRRVRCQHWTSPEWRQGVWMREGAFRHSGGPLYLIDANLTAVDWELA